MHVNTGKRLFFVKNVSQQDVCGGHFYQIEGSEFALPTDIKRQIYTKHNHLECEKCLTSYNSFLIDLNLKHDKFPNCCPLHENLNRLEWFNKEDFRGVPQLVAEKLFLTWDHIQEYYEEDNWRDKILDFLEYVFQSFGSFPEGCGEPLYFSLLITQLEHYLTNTKEQPARKKEILKFISEYTKPKEKGKKKKGQEIPTDFNILVGVYNEWYKAFPFDLSFFSPLKEHFQKNIPIVCSFHTNEYSGLTKATLTTKENLIAHLTATTEKIITTINTNSLHKQGKLLNIDKSELELVVAARQQKLQEGYISNAQNPDTQYRRILKEWFKDELEFIRSIRPIIERAEAKKTSLHESLLYACEKMQENKIFWAADENTRTTQILDILSSNYVTKNQSLLGESGSGKKQGIVDGIVIDINKNEYLIEALNLTDITAEVIQSHITKLEKNYDAKGIQQKYFLIYCNVEDGRFTNLVERYQDFIENQVSFCYEKVKIDLLHTRYTNIRQLTSIHKREASEVLLHHILIKMPKKEGAQYSIG